MAQFSIRAATNFQRGGLDLTPIGKLMLRVITGWQWQWHGRVQRHILPTNAALPRAASAPIRRHWEILCFATCIIFAAFALRVQGDRVALWFLPGLPLPQACQMRSWLGINCPACGLTRSFIHLAHGQWRAAYHIHRLGWLVAALVAGQIPYRMICICYKPVLTRDESRWIFRVLVFLMLANWGLELCRVLPQSG